jgi:hypothetical protein
MAASNNNGIPASLEAERSLLGALLLKSDPWCVFPSLTISAFSVQCWN